MKTLSLTLVSLCLSLVLFGRTLIETKTVYFESDRHLLTDSEKSKISDFIKTLDLSGDCEIQISGHTDHEGTVRYNKELSQKRADAVKNYLQRCGVPSEICVIEWYGETRLLTPGRDTQAKSKNRRVEIRFKRFHFESVDELIEELSRSTKNKFLIDTHSESLLECSDGTKISINNEAFITADSVPYSGEVQVEITEAIHSADFLKNGLATVCDGKILKSGGMVHIEAKSETGQELLLKDEDQLSLALPSLGTPQTGFELFTSESGQNWEQTNQKALYNYPLDIPPRPHLKVRYVRNKIPTFDESTKPHKPIEPVYPRQPTKPRWVSYEREIKWYQFFSSSEIRKKDSINFEDAMMRYRKRMKKYEEDIVVFEERCSKYPTDLALYYKRLASWNQEKAEFIKKQQTKRKYIVDPRINYDKSVKAYKAELKDWEDLRDEAEAEYFAAIDKVGIPQDLDLNYFVFRSTGLGWANCDRFYTVPEGAKMDLVVHVPDYDNYKVYLVFDEDRIVLPLQSLAENQYFIENIPAYLQGTIVSYKVEEGNLYYSEAAFDGQNNYSLSYKRVKVSELKERLNSLGSSLS